MVVFYCLNVTQPKHINSMIKLIWKHLRQLSRTTAIMRVVIIKTHRIEVYHGKKVVEGSLVDHTGRNLRTIGFRNSDNILVSLCKFEGCEVMERPHIGSDFEFNNATFFFCANKLEEVFGVMDGMEIEHIYFKKA